MVAEQAAVISAEPTPGPQQTSTASPLQRPIPEPIVPENLAVNGTPAIEEDNSGSDSVGAAGLVLAPADNLPTTEVVKMLTSSVVNISTEIAIARSFNTPLLPTGVGTGVVLNEDGHILTNNHVLESARSITVTLSSGATVPAEIVGRDPITDLAVVKIEPTDGIEPAQLGDSAELLVGEDVIAIGHAMGFSGAPTVSKGVVSALERSIDAERNTTIVDLIQTDASINPGNSGGPLVNDRAEVIGINTAIISGGQGIGFAININDAKEVARQLIDQGFVRRGYLGILPSTVTPQLAAQLGIDADTEGILIHRVVTGTAADDAGLLAGDIILSMDGRLLPNTGELSKSLISHRPGDTVTVIVLRGTEEVTANVTLAERPVN